MSGVSASASAASARATKSDDEEKKRRAILEERVKIRLEYDNKALRIVERLLDNPITDDFLVDCARFITSQHYKDAVEERSILKQCGYPLCQRSLKTIPKQKYHISMKMNKVYEITERKNFCRQFCYKASKFYEAQLSDSPLWAREYEEQQDIKLFTEEMEADSTAASLISKDHVLLTERIKPEEINKADNTKTDRPLKEEAVGLLADDLSTLTFADTRKRERLRELAEISESYEEPRTLGQIVKDKSSQREERTDSTMLNLPKESSKDDDSHEGTEDTEKQKVELWQHDNSKTKQDLEQGYKEDHANFGDMKIVGNMGMQVDESLQSTTGQAVCLPKVKHEEPKKKKKKSKKSNLHVAKNICLLEVVSRVIMEWKTDKTVEFIRGRDPTGRQPPSVPEAENPNFITQETESAPLTGTASVTSDPLAMDTEPFLPPVKPLPDIQHLKEESENFALKVQEFYYGRPSEVKKGKDTTKMASGDIQENEAVDRPMRLPLVDSKSQMALRRRIISDSLNRVYSEILAPLRLSMRDISSDLQDLIWTFQLSSHNITFKPAVWSMLGLLLLQILAIRNQSIRDSIRNEENPCRFIDMLLTKMGSSVDQLDDVVRRIELGEP